MMSFFRSLTTKLTLSFLLVSLTGALLVALLVGWQTTNQFDQYVDGKYAEEKDRLTLRLQGYYEQTGSWEGIEKVGFRQEGGNGRGDWRKATLTDANGIVVSAAYPYEDGQQLTEYQLQDGCVIEVNGEVVGWVLMDPKDEGGAWIDPQSPEGQFLDNVWRATGWSAIGVIVLALGVGLLLARTIARPIRDLTAATQAIAQGELGRQVEVRTRDEVGELARSFNQMSSDLAQATALRRRMTADIAHDLRTPLSALLGYTEALNEGKFEGSPEIYSVLHQESQHLQRLVDDLHTLSLADAGELPLHRQPTAPEALLERVARAHAAQANARKITLSVQTEPKPLSTVEVDPERMVQVLGNLIRNAFRHTPPGGKVTLSAEQQQNQIYLRVRDTGSGIAPEDLPHIWERLYRADKARSEEGSGLGLAITRSIIEAHGGAIVVQSQPGQGATFTMTLPSHP
jgi:two-component system, OmpR family, sensor histidine kinase BaeS